ncbi:MAG TPA: class I SAM-dependent RNA methyltransferase [Acidimicrobiia bacterium]|nr:class I SAM-dependent RNA methyltransferase [Acidimicrobiia bacterium]
MIEFVPDGIAHGGEAIGRVDGKAHFVDGAIPGERVRGTVVHEKRSWARVALDEIVEASPDRVEPACPHFSECGGCQWQFADPGAQLRWKADIVAGQLRHLGGLAEAVVHPTVAPGPPWRYRNRMDFRVVDGRPALYRWRSRDTIPIETCLLLHPHLQALFDRLDDVRGARSVTLRAATSTGSTLAVVGGDIPAGIDEWGSGVVQKIGRDREPVIGPGWLTESVAGLDFRITADAFFQNNTAGAEVLVALVDEALEASEDETVLDAFAGGGLFGLTAGRRAGRLIAVESDPLALGDLRHNASRSGMERRIVPGRVEEVVATMGERWDLAIVDPPRSGLGARGVGAVVSGGPRVVAYVSCDPASLGRDARLLDEAGYSLTGATPVDLFPQTFHVETVAVFERR